MSSILDKDHAPPKSDYFSLKPPPVLKMPQYSQSSEQTPITPGLRSPGTDDKHIAFVLKPALIQKDPAESPTGSAIVPTPPWDRHGQLPSPFEFKRSTPSRQLPSPTHRLMRRVSIEEPSHFRLEERLESIPMPEQYNDLQRNMLKKSLRRVFVYPIVFVVLWIAPCVQSMLALFSILPDNYPLWLAILSTLCLTLMGSVYCAVFIWSEQPGRQSMGIRSKADKSEDGCFESPSTEYLPSIKAPSLVSNSTGTYTSNGRAPSQGVIQGLSKIQAPKPAQRKNSKVGQHQGGSTTSLAKQLAYERLALEKHDRRDDLQFQRRLSRTSGPSRMSSRASCVTSLGSIPEVGKREWWDAEDEIEEESEEQNDKP